MLIFSGLISGSEVSFFALSPNDYRKIKLIKSKRANLLILLLDNPKLVLATLLIANNFINVSIVILSAYLNNKFIAFSENPIVNFVIQVVLVTMLILFFGEMIPKIYASKNPLRFALTLVKLINILSKILRPLSSLMLLPSSYFESKYTKHSHDISINELSYALELTTSDETGNDENKILKGIVKFGDIDVKEIMKSRIDVVALEYNSKFRKILSDVIESGYSRIPVFQDTFDNVKGILFIKDLLSHLNEKDSFEWQKLLRKPYFVPESKKINILLKEFQDNKNHIAIVVDEYGGTSGIITLEDIVEEIVGEINDEFDVSEENQFIKIDDSNYIFDGKTNLNDFYRIMEIEGDIFDSIKGESDTIAGLLIEVLKEIPRRNKEISLKNFIFRIEAVDKRRIKRVKVKIIQNS